MVFNIGYLISYAKLRFVATLVEYFGFVFKNDKCQKLTLFQKGMSIFENCPAIKRCKWYLGLPKLIKFIFIILSTLFISITIYSYILLVLIYSLLAIPYPLLAIPYSLLASPYCYSTAYSCV